MTERCPRPHPTMSCWRDKDHEESCIALVSIMGDRCGMELDPPKNIIGVDAFPQDMRDRIHRINVQK